MREQSITGNRIKAGVRSGGAVGGVTTARGIWGVRVRDPEGNIVAEERIDNLVTNEGLNKLLNDTLAGGTQSSTWYIGLTDGDPTTDAEDTMGSHDGWSEVTDYDESDRQEWKPGSVDGQSVDNSDDVATFTISSDGTTIGGAFLVDDSEKDGTSGTLYAVGAFNGGDLTLSAGSTLEVTAEFTQSAS